MLFLTLSLITHLPTYDTCVDNCCKPPRNAKISQVMYLKGAGGLEIDVQDLEEGQVLDFDAIFRDEVDQSTYSVYVGCGGCMPDDKIVILSFPLNGYQPAEVEPFTQTAYRSIFPPSSRKFNTSSLTNCAHFTVRLVTNDTSIVWGAVIGLTESFTLVDLLEFPVYILRNHGSTWNGLWYTYWVILFFVCPAVLFEGRSFYKLCCKCYVPSIYDDEVSSAREFLYEISTIGFLAAALEMLLHLLYVQAGNPIEWGFWVGLVIILLPVTLAQTFLYFVWYSIRKPSTCGGCLASPFWAPFEVFTGLTLLLLFGSGFFLGPVSIVLAGLLRFMECKDVIEAPPPIRRA